MIRVQAPGKLFIAGEYAVVEAGEPAVLVAVDRHITIDVTARAAGDAPAGGPRGIVTAGRTGGAAEVRATWTRAGRGIEVAGATTYFRHLLSAVGVVEELAAERGIPQRGCRLQVASTLELDGRKLGLGSSSAVVVATVRALDRLYGLDLDRAAVLKAALLATFRLNPAASGADVAASVFGGWIAYASPERSGLAAPGTDASELIARDWPGLCVRHIPAPARLSLAVGWTGTPAATARLVSAVRGSTAPSSGAFVSRSRDCVRGLITALQDGDDAAVGRSVRTCRALLAGLMHDTGVVIETPRLAALCGAAERVGAAAKPSGAGGGDCGIALVPPEADRTAMLEEWVRHGIRPLDLRVWHDTAGTATGRDRAAGSGGTRADGAGCRRPDTGRCNTVGHSVERGATR